MEYIIFFISLGFVFLLLAVKGYVESKKELKDFVKSLYENYGQIPQREYRTERWKHIGGYYLKHRSEEQLDDITWNDLDMDNVFKRMNYSLSSAGEEYLYYILRTPLTEKKVLEKRERRIEYYEKHHKERIEFQVMMKKLGTTGDYSLFDYLQYLDHLGERNNAKNIAAIVLYLLFILLCFVNTSLGLCGLAVLMVFRFSMYFREKKEIEPYIISFSYVYRLLKVCSELSLPQDPAFDETRSAIEKHRKQLAALKRGASFVITGNKAAGTGNPLELLMDYLNMAFHFDIMLFVRMYRELKKHIGSIEELVTQIGELESSVCIASFRKSLNEGFCIPEFDEDNIRLEMKDGYHPLLSQPVKNSICTEKGVLITGSNASGKSTFLKMTAINACLAQSVHTCACSEYKASFFRIVSSMALKDNLQKGESYYIAEIKSIKRIIDCIGQKNTLCFVDEVLRGTNTVERIAASTQILKSFCKNNVLCFAATHDVELTELLKSEYDNYHFEEEIEGNDIVFPYQLKKGRATSRNAIRLLDIMGYPEHVTGKAFELARIFSETGKWQTDV